MEVECSSLADARDLFDIGADEGEPNVIHKFSGRTPSNTPAPRFDGCDRPSGGTPEASCLLFRVVEFSLSPTWRTANSRAGLTLHGSGGPVVSFRSALLTLFSGFDERVLHVTGL